MSLLVSMNAELKYLQLEFMTKALRPSLGTPRASKMVSEVRRMTFLFIQTLIAHPLQMLEGHTWAP